MSMSDVDHVDGGSDADQAVEVVEDDRDDEGSDDEGAVEVADDERTDHDDSALVVNHVVQSTAGILQRMTDDGKGKQTMHARMNEARQKRMGRVEKSIARMAIVTNCVALLIVVAHPFKAHPRRRRYYLFGVAPNEGGDGIRADIGATDVLRLYLEDLATSRRIGLKHDGAARAKAAGDAVELQMMSDAACSSSGAGAGSGATSSAASTSNPASDGGGSSSSSSSSSSSISSSLPTFVARNYTIELVGSKCMRRGDPQTTLAFGTVAPSQGGSAADRAVVLELRDGRVVLAAYSKISFPGGGLVLGDELVGVGGIRIEDIGGASACVDAAAAAGPVRLEFAMKQ